MKRILFIIALTLSFELSALSLFAGSGTTGASFLKIGPGARAVGMGEAFVAVADDATALYWNPAGIVQLKTTEVAFMHSMWFQGTSYDYLAYVQQLPGPGNEKFGFNLTYMNYGNFTRTLEDASGNYTGTGGDFTAFDLAAGLTYAWELSAGHSLGANLKFLHSVIDVYSGNALSIDFGYLFRLSPELSIGVNAQNSLVSIPERFYLDRTPVSSSSYLPINGKIGIAYRKGRMLAAFDVNFPIENAINFCFGSEYRINDNVAVRVGYKTALIQDIDLLSGLCAGMGFSWQGYNVDYAFVPYGDLGYTHRISLSAKF